MQIYLDDEQTGLLDQRASALGTTRSELIREAIGIYLEGGSGDNVPALARFRVAVAQAAGSAPELTPGPDYVEALRAADVARLDELDHRRK